MSIEFDDKNNVIFTVNYHDMMEALSNEQKIELVESLSCEDAVIKHVMDQVIEGWTENGHHGSKRGGANPSTQLEYCRDNLRKVGNRLLIKEVNRLRDMLEDKRSHYESGWNEYHKLFNERHGRYEI